MTTEHRPLRVAVVSDEGTGGGASIAATRLCVALRALEHHITRLYWAQAAPPLPESADEAVGLDLSSRLAKRVTSLIKSEATRRHTQARWCDEFRRALAQARPDVIHIHNIHGAGWDIEVVEECLRHAPVVWTLHDMWPITGSCAYAYGCTKFHSRCDATCPQAGTYPTLRANMVSEAQERRARLAATGRVTLVAPSEWMAREAKASRAWRDATVHCIPYGLDLDVFRPLDETAVRAMLGVPNDGRLVITAGAASLSDPRKGLRQLVDAINQLAPDIPVRLVLIGSAGREIMEACRFPVFPLGPVKGDRFLALAHNTGDVFVLPSLMDNLPLMVQEAMACGVPCVVAGEGGPREMVEPGLAGWVAGVGGHGLSGVIQSAIAAPKAETRYAARQFAIARWTSAGQAMKSADVLKSTAAAG